jgi:hypothetical protein
MYVNWRTREQGYQERDAELSVENVATSVGGRATRFSTDDTPYTIVLHLADGPASKGGTFAYELEEAEILYQQLHALLRKD